jgi:hypothetical protein
MKYVTDKFWASCLLLGYSAFSSDCESSWFVPCLNPTGRVLLWLPLTSSSWHEITYTGGSSPPVFLQSISRELHSLNGFERSSTASRQISQYTLFRENRRSQIYLTDVDCRDLMPLISRQCTLHAPRCTKLIVFSEPGGRSRSLLSS